MKFLFASDSLKGTLSSEQTSELLTKAAGEVFEDCECEGIPVADGGEGTTDAVVRAVHGEIRRVTVHGPLMEPEEAFYGILDKRRAVMEMAAASGLPMLAPDQLDPRKTTSYGTGELLKAILDQGCTDIFVAIGGSATNDGGMGCMRALGVKFLDRYGNELAGRGEDLGKVAKIDSSGLDPRLRELKITAMCDVTNPLCGENGATYTFGPQKGGTAEMLDELERGMQNYREVIIREYGVDPDEMPGSGAAGGLGAALLVFLNAALKSGIETVLDLIDFDKKLEGVSLVVTGEGRADRQSCFGKVMQGVGSRCKRAGIPAIALVGSIAEGAEQIFDYGIDSIMTTVNAAMSLEDALENTEDLYYRAAVRMFRLVRAGMQLR